MNKLEQLYNEKACKEALREVNIELLERSIKKAPEEKQVTLGEQVEVFP